jgi:hypothetical protein
MHHHGHIVSLMGKIDQLNYNLCKQHQHETFFLVFLCKVINYLHVLAINILDIQRITDRHIVNFFMIF